MKLKNRRFFLLFTLCIFLLHSSCLLVSASSTKKNRQGAYGRVLGGRTQLFPIEVEGQVHRELTKETEKVVSLSLEEIANNYDFDFCFRIFSSFEFQGDENERGVWDIRARDSFDSTAAADFHAKRSRSISCSNESFHSCRIGPIETGLSRDQLFD